MQSRRYRLKGLTVAATPREAGAKDIMNGAAKMLLKHFVGRFSKMFFDKT